MLNTFGREAHVISLDGWLKPNNQRSEGYGVRERYDLKAASAEISSVAGSKTREVLTEKVYDRVTRIAGPMAIEHSIGPEDVMIIEGVPALLMEELNTMLNTVKVYVHITPAIRAERLSKDYAWRGQLTALQANTLAMRELDETPVVLQSRNLADFIIE